MKNKWQSVKLREVLTERKEKPSLEAVLNGRIPIVAKIGFDTGRIELREDSKTKTNMILIKPGDLVISGINAAKGAIALYDEGNTKPAAATIHYSSYIINSKKANPLYLWYFMRSDVFRKILLRNLPNGIKTEVKPQRLLPIEIPLPPLEEQKRIVARIEELAAQISEAKALRKQAAEEVEALVTASISALSNDSDCWRRVEDAVSKRKGSVRSGPFGSQLLHEEFTQSGIAAIGTRDVQTDHFELKSGWFVSPERFEQLRRYQVFAGDILCTIVGASIGRFCVVPHDVPLAFTTKHIQALTLDLDKSEPRFVSLMLNFHRRCRESLFSQVEGSAQPSLNAGKVLGTELPLPSLLEQRRIVAELAALQAEVDKLRRLQAETEKELEELVPSIFDKAFKGEL